MIALFEAHAQMLDACGRQTNVEDATVMLAVWLSLNQGILSEDDMAQLVEVGGILFREGLEHRLQQRLKDIGR
ncbi:hypothetical protein [uncultured Aquitalea sp.]|nr:hypothetical protein [uncultured Aquitalea sp.]